jgi:hypothetical protein
MTILSRLLVTCVAVCLIASVAEAKAKKDKGRHDPTVAIKKKLDAASLPTDILTNAKKIVDEQAPKLKDAQAKVDAVLTSEQKSAKKTAAKDAKAAGKKRKEARADVDAAMKLTDEQKTKLAEAEKELKAAQSSLTSALGSVLTPDQLAKAGLKTRKKKA